MKADSPIVQEVRDRAEQISARFGHDVRAYAQHLKKIEERCADRVESQVTVVPADATRRPTGSVGRQAEAT